MADTSNQSKDKPTEINSDGTKRWKNDKGEFHRIDGPAIEYSNGTKSWYLNGEFHREDGPAYEGVDGSKFWLIKGKLHREDGPALEWADGTKEWFLNGHNYSEEGFNKKVTEIKDPPTEIDSDGNKIWKDDKGNLHRLDGPAVEYTNGTKAWFVNGKYHRIDGPAIEYAHGTKAWWINGLRHREDGPAIEGANGDKEWYLNGQRHRLDGPAIEWADGTKHWYIEGNKYSEEQFNTIKERQMKVDDTDSSGSSNVEYILSVKDHKSVYLKPTSKAPILTISFDPEKFTYTIFGSNIEPPIVGMNITDVLSKAGIPIKNIKHLERRLVFTTDNDGFSKLTSVTKNGDVQLNAIGYKYDSLAKEYNILTKNNPFSLQEKVVAPTDVLARFKLLEMEPFIDFFNITSDELDTLIAKGSVIIKSDSTNLNGSYYQDIFNDEIMIKYEADEASSALTDEFEEDEFTDEYDDDEDFEEDYDDEDNLTDNFSVSGAKVVENRVESVNPEQKKESAMSITDRIKSDKTVGVLVNAGENGLKLAGARQASRTIADIIGGVVEALMEKSGYKEYIPLIHTDLGRAILEMSAPVILHMALQQGIIPASKYNEQLEAVSRWAIQANTQKYTMEYSDKVGDFIKAALTDPSTQSNLKSLIKLSSALSQAEAGNSAALESITNPMGALDALFAEAEEVKR